MEALLGPNVINDKGEKVDVSSFCGEGKYVGLYFSAHWCPPCRGFTPVLSDFYKKFKAGPRRGELEIVFVSGDSDQAAFDEYFGEMPWLAIDYSDRDTEETLSSKYDVQGIPTFIILNSATGEVVQKAARGKVSADPEGKDFPWRD